MNKKSAILLVPVVASTMTLGACGGSSSSASSAKTTTQAGSGTSTSAPAGTTPTTGATTADQCPTSNARSFAKTRFVADIGLAGGTFHRYIYAPYQAGSFTKGADKRTSSIAKAVTVAALDTHLINNAYKNVQASPALCKALVVPMGQLKDVLGGLKGQLMTGNLAAIATADSLVKKIEGGAAANGAPVSENADLATAQKATTQG